MKIGVIQVLLLLLFSGILCLIRGDNTSTSVNFKSSSTEDHTTPDTPTLTQNDSIISPTTIFTTEENSYSTNGPTSPTTVPKNMNTSPTQTKFTTKLSSIISTTSTTESQTTTHLTRDSTDIETTFSLTRTTADIKTSESRHTTDTLLSTSPKTLPSSATTLLSTSTKTLPSSATTLLSTSTKTLPSPSTTLLSTLTKTSASLATTSLSTSPKTLTSAASSATSTSPSSTLVTLKTTPNQNRPSSQTKKSGMSPGGKAALGIFIVIVLVAAAVLGLLWYRRKYGSVRWTNLTSSVAYKRYTDDDTINMGHVGN